MRARALVRMQAQTLVRSKLAFRPPDVNSQLARNAARAAGPAKGAREAIKGSLVLKDFRQEHLEAVDREQEALKLKCALFIRAAPICSALHATAGRHRRLRRYT